MIARLLPAAVLLLGSTATAAAQTVPAGQAKPAVVTARDPTSLRGRVSIMISAGSDLDVLGHVLTFGEGLNADRGTFVNQQAYPDAYFGLPFRGRIAAGIGFSSANEVFGRYSGTTYKANEVEVGGIGQTKMFATLTAYHDRTIEAGLRHYFARKTVAKYVSLAYGIRKVDAISGTFTAGSDKFTARIYDAGTRRTFALEFGMLFQTKHIGVFVEGGAQITSALLRNDTDLVLVGLETINDTAGRFYMPAHVGVLFRF